MALFGTTRIAVQLLVLIQLSLISPILATAASSSSSSSASSSSSSSAADSEAESAIASSALTSKSEGPPSSSSQAVCTVKGRVFTERKWYGYLVHKAFHQHYAKIQYQITYPVRECCADLLIYYDDQVKELKSEMTCEDRKNVLPADNNQVIPLRKENDGCTVWDEKGESFYVCRGERIFRSRLSRTWFFALSRCGQTGPLNLNYVFNITGYYGECEEDPLAPSSGWNSYVGYLDNDPHSSSDQGVYKYLSISLGVVAGLALILAAVFFGLWFLGLRNAAKGKGSSVTSSQATMTQDDIFYVNPSLSDQGHQEYSQSGSENYYEVIPERRSYESINAGLANGGTHLRPLRQLHSGALGHHPHHHPGHHPHQHIHGHPIGHPHGIHHPHPLNHGGGIIGTGVNSGGSGGGGLHHTTGRSGQVKDLGQNVRGVTYMFEDYPPPPYQPPKGKASASSLHNPNMMTSPGGIGGPTIMGSIGIAPSSSAAIGHQHTLSLPVTRGQQQHQQQQQQQQQRQPNFAHHAYHSSIVPTSAALGLDNNTSIALGHNATTSSGLNLGINTSGNAVSSNSGGIGSGAGGVLMSVVQSSLNDVGYRPDTVPVNATSGMSMSNPGQGLNLGTFGISSNNNNNNSSSNNNSNNIIISSSSNNHPASNLGLALNSTSGASAVSAASSSSQVPPPAPGGQCETSA